MTQDTARPPPQHRNDEPDEPRDEAEMDDEKAAKALNKIEELRQKLEPRG